MTRVLHVLDQPAPTGEALTLKLSADVAAIEQQADPTERHAWLLLGGEPMRDAARAVGLDDAHLKLLPRPAGLTRWLPGGAAPIRRLLALADRVACWTVGAGLIVSAIGCGHATPRFGQATLCGFARGVIDAALQRQRDAGRGSTGSRTSLRERWGVDDDTTVVALLADRPERVDAAGAALAVALAYETLAAGRSGHRDVRLLCHPLHHGRSDALQLVEQLNHPHLVIQDAGLLTPWNVLHGCDAALAPVPMHAGLSMLWADGLGLPMIAAPEPRLPAMEGLQHLTPARSAAPKHLADALTRLLALEHSKPRVRLGV